MMGFNKIKVSTSIIYLFALHSAGEPFHFPVPVVPHWAHS